ncbi:MAG TPA: antibiotic biosynthesis monooxygenase [Beijerinckiaceae bacterium]|nr:antibiotic biosynthesis monooxygenase [Beijerinckiaceae bacterium]
MRLALASPGCLGAESARNDKDLGITVSYWENEASILAFKADADHRRAQQRGSRGLVRTLRNPRSKGRARLLWTAGPLTKRSAPPLFPLPLIRRSAGMPI